MENAKNLFSLNMNTAYRIGGHYYLPKNESWMMENHVFDQNIFYYIISGKCIITIDGKEYKGTTGQWFFIPAGAKYSYKNCNDEAFEKYWIHFDLYPNSDLLDSLCLQHCINVKDNKYIESLFEDFEKVCKSFEFHDRIKLNGIILMLLSEYIKRAGQKSVPFITDKKNELYRVLNYINENMEKPLSNALLAENLHIHPNHFIRYFKSETGETPQHYIMMRRVEAAKKLLEETALSTSEIAEMTGLCDSAHLSKLFKKIYAISPTQYRKITKISTINKM